MTEAPMSADMRQMLRDLEDEIESACASHNRAIDRAVPYVDEDAIIIEEEGKPPTIDMRELRSLLAALEDAAAKIESAFDDFDWRVARALKTFRQQMLAREAAP
jgi:hypothetical protein